VPHLFAPTPQPDERHISAKYTSFGVEIIIAGGVYIA